MLLHALYKEGLKDEPPAYSTTPRIILYTLTIDENGFKAIASYDRTHDLPFVKRTCNITPNPLYDWLTYIVGDISASTPGERFDSFWAEAAKLANEAKDSRLAVAIKALLANQAWRSVVAGVVGKKDGAIAIAIDGSLAIERKAIVEHFKNASRLEEAVEGTHICVLTHKPCVPARLHDSIRKYPGTENGAPLISFQAPTSKHRSLEQGLNFPISVKAMKAYTRAFSAIVRDSTVSIGDIGLSIWGVPGIDSLVRIIKGAANGRSPEEIDTELKLDWEVVEKLAKSESKVLAHLLVGKGSKGRIAILYYEPHSVARLARHALAFREHFVNRNGREVRIYSKIRRVDPARSLFKQKGNLAHLEVAALICSVLVGSELPSSFVHFLYRRFDTARPLKNEPVLQWLSYHNDIPRKTPPMTDEEPVLQKYVIEGNSENEPYILGRLIALEYAMKNAYHKRILSEVPTQGWLRQTCLRPCAFFPRFDQSRSIYETRMDSKWKKALVSSARELTTLLRSDYINSSRPLSYPQRASLHQGYLDQRNYNIALAIYHSRRIAEKRAAKTPEDAAAQ